MKNLKAILLLAITTLLLVSCGSNVNKEGVDNLIFDYTEHMEIVSYGEDDDVAQFLYFGNATVSVKDDDEAVILATRFDESQENFVALGIMGYLNDGLFEDGSYCMYEMGIATYSLKAESSISITLETDLVLDELVTVSFNTYVEQLKELTYADLVYAEKTLAKRSF